MEHSIRHSPPKDVRRSPPREQYIPHSSPKEVCRSPPREQYIHHSPPKEVHRSPPQDQYIPHSSPQPEHAREETPDPKESPEVIESVEEPLPQAPTQAIATPLKDSPSKLEESDLEVLHKEFQLSKDLLDKSARLITAEVLDKLTTYKQMSNPEMNTVKCFLKLLSLVMTGIEGKKMKFG
jgi:hypothetical protein